MSLYNLIFWANAASDEITKIETAFASYASNTCLRMVKRTTEADYIEIIRDGGYVPKDEPGVQKRTMLFWISITSEQILYVSSQIHIYLHIEMLKDFLFK